MPVISSGDVATFKLGNLSSLMQSSGRRAYNELFFSLAAPAQLTTFVACQGVARIFLTREKSVWGDLHLVQLFFSGEPKLFSINVAWCRH